MKLSLKIFLLSLICILSVQNVAASTRQERRLINKGNELYNEHKYKEAQSAYEEALLVNGSSYEAIYNLGLSKIRQVSNPQDTTSRNSGLMNDARKHFSEVASVASVKPALAQKANFNLGNIEFNVKDYKKAIEYYKEALRINPNDDKARKNLRIAQKNLEKQNQDKNQQDNKDQQKEQDKKEQQNQDKNNDSQNNNNQDNQKEQQQQDNSLSQQTASQILQAIDNKEAQTRARVNKANTGEKSAANGVNNRKW